MAADLAATPVPEPRALAYSAVARPDFPKWVRLLLSPVIIGAVSAACYRIFGVNSTTAGFVYLIAVLAIATVWGLAAALAASAAAVFCFGFFFLPPVGRFAITGPENWVALFAFLVTALVASHLSELARKQARDAKTRQRESEMLYELSRAILLTEDLKSFGVQMAENLVRTFGCRAAALYDAETGEIFCAGSDELPAIDRELQRAVGRNTVFRRFRSGVVLAVIRVGERSIGSIALQGISISNDAFQAVLNLAAIVLERVHIQQAANRADAARQSEEFKSTLLDAITHEFKTPLTTIKAASSSIFEDTPLTAETKGAAIPVRELAAIIHGEADRLNRLVTDAVRMAKIDASQIQLERQAIAVKEFVDRVLTDFGPRLEERSVEASLADSLPKIFVDPDLAAIALRQVIDNGLKYSLPGTPLAITAANGMRLKGAAGVTIRVRDHGPGIPDSDKERVFEKFYRRASVATRVPGSGLGLYVAREIVRAHGGDLWAEGAADAGTEFCLAFPVPIDVHHEATA